MSKHRITVTHTIKQVFEVDIPDDCDPWGDWSPGDDDAPVQESAMAEITSVEKVQ